MNKLSVAIFDTETAAAVGLRALGYLHAAGDFTLFATAVLARDAKGSVSVKEPMDSGPIGTANRVGRRGGARR